MLRRTINSRLKQVRVIRTLFPLLSDFFISFFSLRGLRPNRFLSTTFTLINQSSIAIIFSFLVNFVCYAAVFAGMVFQQQQQQHLMAQQQYYNRPTAGFVQQGSRPTPVRAVRAPINSPPKLLRAPVSATSSSPTIPAGLSARNATGSWQTPNVPPAARLPNTQTSEGAGSPAVSKLKTISGLSIDRISAPGVPSQNAPKAVSAPPAGKSPTLPSTIS